MNIYLDENLKTAIIASLKAGKEILKIYQTDFDVEYKADESPLTIADRIANEVIISYLNITCIPVLSEEGRSIPYDERKNWKELWVVDPLDGTKEFVKKNNEFTVNIALIREGIPILGVVYLPVLDELYFGMKDFGAYKIECAFDKITKRDDFMNFAVKLPIRLEKSYFGIVASRSHLSPETTAYIDEIRKGHDEIKIISKGSSLKICMVAEGTADVYPRFAPTKEWDTAAGHAVVLASGGRIVQASNPEKEIIYNKEELLNPWFIVTR